MNISNIKYQKQTSLNLWHLWCIPGHLKNKSPFKWPPGEQTGHLLSLLVSFLFFEGGSSHLGISKHFEELRNNVMSQLQKKWCKWYIHTRISKSCSYRVLKLSHDEWIQLIASGSWHVFSSLTLVAKEQILAAKTERRVVNTQLAILRWTLKNEDQTNVQLVVELQACIHCIQTPIKQY